MQRIEIDNQVIYHGHAIATLAQLPERSVHACVTSPPYFGLRRYGTNPQIWGGDPNCKHRFTTYGVRHKGGQQGKGGQRNGRANVKDQNAAQHYATGQFCTRCKTAWRGELGSEPHPALFVDHLVLVFDAVRRALRDDGLLWVNIGDSHWTAKGSCFNPGGGELSRIPDYRKSAGVVQLQRRNRSDCDYLKPGDKCAVPERFALAMQAAGWYWRQTIVWNKPSCMPESVGGCRWERHRLKVRNGAVGKPENGNGREKHGKSIGEKTTTPETYAAATPDRNGKARLDHSGNELIGRAEWIDCPGCDKCTPNGGLVLRRGSWRPTTSHEYIFEFAKTDSYWANAEAVKEPHGFNRWSDRRGVNAAVLDDVYDDEAGDSSVLRAGTINCFPEGGKNPRSVWTGDDGTDIETAIARWVLSDPAIYGQFLDDSRNDSSVWTIGPEPLKGPHYAAFPSELATRCIRPSVPERCCPTCGAGWAPVIQHTSDGPRDLTQRSTHHYNTVERYGGDNGGNGGLDDLAKKMRDGVTTRVIGYRPTCECNAGEPVPGTVLDPFAGSGTTLMVSKKLGLRGIGCELSAEYIPMIISRIRNHEALTRQPDLDGQATFQFQE